MAKISPLHAAAFGGDVAKVRELIDSGADLSVTNSAGATPLHSAYFFSGGGLDNWASSISTDAKFAAAKTKLEVARLLLAKGASPDVKDKFGKTPLELAPTAFELARAGLLEPLRELLAPSGTADPLAPSDSGSTLLHAAAFCGMDWAQSRQLCGRAVQGKVEVARFLIGLGLSPDAADQAGRTPRSVCEVITSPSNTQYLGTKYGPGPIYSTMSTCLSEARSQPVMTAVVAIPVDAIPVEAPVPTATAVPVPGTV